MIDRLSAFLCKTLLCYGWLFMALLSLAAITYADQQATPVVKVCFNYDCNRTASVRPSVEEWQAVVSQLTPPATSAIEERRMIRRAVAVLEHVAGTQTPTYRDRGRNAIPETMYGQMDCIDESINTTRYLALLESRGLLHWHRVGDRIRRAPLLFDVHWAGQVIEQDTLNHYVVDSWHLDNGELPYIQTQNDWLRKEPLE